MGKTVLTYDLNNRVYHIGVIDGDYAYRPDLLPELPHTRAVKWTGSVKRDELSPGSKNSLGAISTIFCVSETAAEEIVSVAKSGIPRQPELDIVQGSIAEAEAEVRKDTEQRALEFLQDRLNKLAWDEMQELVAGLFVQWGTRLVCPRQAPTGAKTS